MLATVDATVTCTAAEAADAAGVHPNMARRHLERLETEGLVSSITVADGPGRPSRRYTCTPAGRSALAPPDQLADEYIALAAAFAEQLAAASSDPAPVARAVGRGWGERLAAGSGGVIDVLDRLGFSPRERGDVVELRTCPLLEAATAHPEVVCEVHLGLVRGVDSATGGSGEGGELTPFAEPGACHLRLPPRP